MKRRRGRRRTAITATVCILVLGVVAWAARSRLLELWYLHRLLSSDRDTRENAALQLAVSGTARAVPPLLSVEGIEQGDIDKFAEIVVRPSIPTCATWTAGFEGLRRLGAAEAILLREPLNTAPVLVSALESEDKTVRGRAFEVIAFPIVVQHFLKQGLESNVRSECGRQFILYHQAVSAGQLPVLLETATRAAVRIAKEETDSEIRLLSIRMLGWVGASATAPLLEVLRTGDGRVRCAVMSSFGEMGGEAREAVPDVLQVISTDPDPLVRRSAVEALSSIAEDGVLPTATINRVVEDVKADPDERVRAASLDLERVGQVVERALRRREAKGVTRP